MFSSAVLSTAPNYLTPIVLDADNALKNSLYDESNDYYVGYGYNGLADPNLSPPYRSNQFGVNKVAPFWRHYCPTFVSPSNNSYYTHIGGHWLDANPPYQLQDAGGAAFQRVWKSFGAGSLFGSGTQGTHGLSNDNADRGDDTVGYHSGGSSTRIVGHTTLSTIDGNTSMDNTACWIRSDEWYQGINVPDTAVTCKAGMKVRIPPSDQLRPYNWCGYYVWSESNNGTSRIVDYVRIHNTTGGFTLPTGSLTGDQAEYNWNGMSNEKTNTDSGSAQPRYSTPSSVTANEKLTIDQDDVGQWTDLEFTVTLESGTSRKIGFGWFFAESAKYCYDADADLSGGFQVFNPYVTFHS